MPDTTYLDWPFFDDSHREFAKELSAWAEKEIAPLQADDHHTNEALDASFGKIIDKLGKAGWLKYTVPAAYGGALDNLDVRSIALARSILGYHTGLADFAFAMQGL
ncbi:MAG: acyl-CoA dehydrogenase family protein, partial [Rhodospirillales bacterium]|nr:acyl-CoA dehydrogenase family protein [Rhodospirillales bacterium]